MEQDFDLHLHTSFSDGQDTVDELINKIRKTNVNIFSITDHDDIKSVKEVLKNDLKDLSYIKGIEVSSILDNHYKMHILGYDYDETNKELINMTEKLKKSRKKRFYELYEDLERRYGFKIPDSEIKKIAESENVPGKPHLARLMIKYKYVDSVPEAFTYLEELKTKTSNRYPADQVIKIIHDAGGIAIWAHPGKVESKYNIDFQELMPRLLELGLDGIEPFNSLHSYDDCLRFYDYAKKNNLLVSGGSDYHGLATKPNIKIGVVYKTEEKVKIFDDDIDIISIKEDL